MLSSIFRQFRPAPVQDSAARRRQATAILLHELAHADHAHSELELAQLRSELAQTFHIPPEEVDALLQTAVRTAQQTVSLHEEIAHLNQQLDAGEKRELIAMLWRLAVADGRLDPHEEALIRRLADLLFVSHAVFVQEKLKAVS